MKLTFFLYYDLHKIESNVLHLPRVYLRLLSGITNVLTVGYILRVVLAYIKDNKVCHCR